MFQFFQFWASSNFNNPEALRGVHFYDVHLGYYVASWPTPSMPHPGVFEDSFPWIVDALMPHFGTVTLFVKGIDSEWFDESNFLRSVLVPRRLNYILLAPRGSSSDSGSGLDLGNLVFEWPANEMDYVVREFFRGPSVVLEGYISEARSLGRIADVYYQATTPEEKIVALLHDINVGFQVWPDGNGLFLASISLDSTRLRQRLVDPELERLIAAAASGATDVKPEGP
ncbi:MAG: hypothetical protein HY294_07170 [Candidatus Rokubacteria bacterium]|nr:hypothetical protein [Candidatus Rokubacteria bacterium]